MQRDRPALFKGRHFELEIIILCVRRYLGYALSFRNLEEIMAEQNVMWITSRFGAGSGVCRRPLLYRLPDVFDDHMASVLSPA
jgi:hypothetical protein